MTSGTDSAASDDGTDRPIKVLLVEDDDDLRMGLADYLRLSGLQVLDVASGLEFYRALRRDAFDIAILDVNLPDASGFDLARDLAAEGAIGLIMLTARTAADDRIHGYAEGADLYLTKPIESQELLLAVRNLSRRMTAGAARRGGGQSRTVPSAAAAPWHLDVAGQRLAPPGGEAIPLSGRELLLLEFLAAADGATVPRAMLAQHLGYDLTSLEGRGFDAVVRRLRKKAHERGVELPLRAVHAVGIRFSAPLTASRHGRRG